MINAKLLEIIKELKKQSKTDDEIYNILGGYKVPFSEIKENLDYFYKNNLFIEKNIPKDLNDSDSSSIASLTDNSSKKSVDKSKILIISLVFLIIIGLGVLVFILMNKPSGDINNNFNDTNTPDINTIENDINLSEMTITDRIDFLSSYKYPLNQEILFNIDLLDPDTNQNIIIDGNIYFLDQNTFDITYNLTGKVFSEDQLYSEYAGYAMVSFLYPSIVLHTYDNESLSLEEFSEVFLSHEKFSEFSDQYLKSRYFLLTTLIPEYIFENDFNNYENVKKISSAILNLDKKYNNFNLQYNLDYNSEIITVFELLISNQKEIVTKIYELETQEVSVETKTYQEYIAEILDTQAELVITEKEGDVVTRTINSVDSLTGDQLPTITLTTTVDILESLEQEDFAIIAMPSIKDSLIEMGYEDTHPRMRTIGPFYQIYPQGISFGGDINFSFCYFDEDVGNFNEELFYIGKETSDVWENIGGIANPSQNCVDITFTQAPDYSFGIYAGIE